MLTITNTCIIIKVEVKGATKTREMEIMSDKIMEMLNNNEKARMLKESFETYVKESNLTKEQEAQERELMILLAMTLVPETIKMIGREVYEKINA